MRFRVEPDRKLLLKDVVKGRVVFDTNTLGDFVVMRSNGLPVYNFCVAIDDAYMKITHVMRYGMKGGSGMSNWGCSGEGWVVGI